MNDNINDRDENNSTEGTSSQKEFHERPDRADRDFSIDKILGKDKSFEDELAEKACGNRNSGRQSEKATGRESENVILEKDQRNKEVVMEIGWEIFLPEQSKTGDIETDKVFKDPIIRITGSDGNFKIDYIDPTVEKGIKLYGDFEEYKEGDDLFKMKEFYDNTIGLLKEWIGGTAGGRALLLADKAITSTEISKTSEISLADQKLLHDNAAIMKQIEEQRKNDGFNQPLKDKYRDFIKPEDPNQRYYKLP